MLSTLLVLALLPAAPPDPSPAEAPAVAAVSGEGAEEAEAEAAGAARLAAANEALLQARPLDAAIEAHRALAILKPSAEKYESAEFLLAEALVALGLEQGAAELYFAVIEQRQNPALLPRALAGLERLARRGRLDDERLLRSSLIDADLATVPDEMASFLSYHRGLSNLRTGDRRWAAADFAAIREGTYYAQLAALVDVVVLVKDGQTVAAVEKIEPLLAREDLEADVRARLRIIRARLAYERGDLGAALADYTEVRSTSESPEGQLLLERAWTFYRAGRYHDAMGLIYALGAPSSRALFLPDQYILRGLIYQRFCHFRAAKQAVRAFRTRYGEAIAALSRGVPPPEVEVVVRAAERLPELRGVVVARRAALDEKARLSDLGGDAKESGLVGFLDGLYTVLVQRSEREYAARVVPAARWTAERLLAADEQASLLQYEVGVSIFKPIDPASGKVRRAPAEKVPTSGPLVYFPFDDEFWTDELGSMRFLIEDRCVD